MQRISPSFITFVSMKSDKRVLLGMSGGTDSSVAAMRLQEAGYEVTGVTFRFYEAGDETGYLEDARALALKLGMKHITYDARELFRSRIICYFVEEYLRGRTPVPCTVCNNELKWALLAKIADEKGIYWISTGHYVRKVLSGGKYYIAPAADKDKDQTFFLWGLKQDILQRMLLPMGDITKNEARSYAAERGFGQVAAKKDSIGVCFCPLDYRSFLKREVPETLLPGKGRFVDEKGNFLGWHEGYPFYTVGQRRGLGIHLNKAVFVKETRVESNEVVLAPLSSLYRQEMWLGDWNLVENSRVLGANEVIVKIRYRKQDILQRMLLPMGDITKNEARSYAAERGFGQVAAKKDSIGVCFCPLDYRSFLKREVPETLLPGKGRFVDEKGNFLGWHEGYPFYTVGQRRGLGIHLNKAVFVKETRVESNEVVLAPLSSLYRQEMWLGDWNLVENSRVLGANEVIVKIRYRKQANRCRVTLTVEGLLRVRLIEPLESIAPGQAAAFYDKDGYLLGGGIIL